MPPRPTEAEVQQNVAVPKPNPRNNPTMFQIFQNVQYNVVQHKKYVKEMKKLFKKLDEDVFRESFKNALHYLFTFGDTSANVDRVIQFVATFCTSLDDEEEFLLFIFDIIFDCQCVSGQSVRYRASQLLAAVLAALGDDASLDDDLCDKLLASQMQRLQDTRGAVRCRAALALQRLQNPMEPDDEVTRAYRFHMSCDPSSSVRRAVVMSIAKCSRNVSFVLERLCDVDEAVRRAAFLYVSAVNATQLRVRQRVLTLKVGLTERSPRVKRVVEEILIPGWLASFQGNVVELLKAIRLDNAQDAEDSEYVAGKLLESLFKRLPVSELLEWLPIDKTLRLIPAEKLNKETAWYWRHLVEHLQKIEDDDTLETVLPDYVVLIGYIKAILEAPVPADSAVASHTRQHVLSSLGALCRADVSDPAARAALLSLVCDMLAGEYGHLSAPVIRTYVVALEQVLPDLTPRLEMLCGVISALREPEEKETREPVPAVDTADMKLQRARLRVSLNVAIEAQEEAVRDQNYVLAAECKAKVEDIQKQLEDLTVQPELPPPVTTLREKVSDPDTINRCLMILNAALDTPQLTSITPMLQTMFNELEVEIFQNPDVLENALQTVALYGILNKDFARDNKAFFFANLIDTSNEPIVTTVLRCVVDLLCVHGASVFEDEGEMETTRDTSKRRSTFHAIDDDGTLSESALSISPGHSTVIELLLKIMDSTCAAYRLIVVEGLCRLIHLGHLESPTILSRLILLWFNPATADEDMLRQIIGVFFQTFPESVEGAQEQIQKATLPTLRALANAPSNSPLSEVDQEAVVKFIVSLTRINHELEDGPTGLATVLCEALSRRPAAAHAGLAARALALLPPPRVPAAAALLLPALRALAQKLPDKQSCRNLTRYLGAVEASERLSMNKMSHCTGITETEGSLAPEDSLAQIGRITASLPQPLARSTHVVINETVEEEPEIDETSPPEGISKISAVTDLQRISEDPKSPRQSSESEPQETKETASDDSSGVSPEKKPKISKAKKKKLSTNKQPSEAKAGRSKQNSKKEEEDKVTGGVKRSRSQRSLVDVERAQKAKDTKSKATPPSPPSLEDLDVSNVTVRKSTRGIQSSSSTESTSSLKGKKNGKTKKAVRVEKPTRRSTRSSAGSRHSAGSDSLFDSADETELHTIVYEQELQQSLLEQSADFTENKKANVTIPETPEASDESQSDPEPEVKPKGKRGGKKK